MSASAVFQPDTDAPIRSELFSAERLEQHAETLAAAQRVTARRTACRRLARRLQDNGRVLLDNYRDVEQAVRDERPIAPADEWLLDNFYLAQEQMRQIRRDFPRGFCRGLPSLAAGPLAGYPRVFGLAWAFVAHTDSRLNRDLLVRFVGAYQRVQPLTIGELWAVPITLRVVLVENLRRSSDQIARARAGRQEADVLANRLLGVGGRAPEPPDAALRRFDGTRLPSGFVVRLLQRLRDQDPRVDPALIWLDQRLADQGTNAEAIVREEHQRQVGINVTVRNVITSMRLISALDWRQIFESMSLVDAALRADSVFSDMDFPTRDRYRHAIEQLARGSGLSELDVTQRAMAAAKPLPVDARDPADRAVGRERDPGYYLISTGRRTFEKAIGFRVPIGDWASRASTAAGIVGYVASIGVVVAFALAVPLIAVSEWGVAGWPLIVLAVLAVAPTSDLAVALINRGLTNDLHPKTLPALELRGGVPASLRTMVVVPTLLTSRAEVDEQIERLEVHHLASRDGDLRFGLLSDWTDSATETTPGDDDLLDAAVDGIARLNRRYGATVNGPRFFLLHRRRLWNEGQGGWIGWERKRGKLHELNRWLRGATDTTFVPINGVLPVPPSGVRYVITLDADTRLPPEAAKRLVGKMAHPLNRPRLDPRSGRVVEGYAVLQPRVTPALPTSQNGSLFQRVFTSPSGLDPYAFAVSDVYQDLFGEGSYTGKGIYDVDMFEAALAQRIPESTLLSHDLLEGIFARAGLASDIEVVEEFPARYDVAAARQHRWARGDWQLLPWIFGSGRDANHNPGHCAIPLIGRWKMLDNLRRTVSVPAAFLALLVGWTLPFPAAVMWSAFVVSTFAIPTVLPVIAGIVPRRLGVAQQRHWRAVGADVALALLQIALLVTLVAHQAWLMTDAIVRTLARLFVRQRRLLEWVTAAQSKIHVRSDLREWYRWMAGGIVLTLGAGLFVARMAPGSWPIAAPFLILWMLSPAVARRASVPSQPTADSPMSDTDARALRLIARRTWRFFETFVTDAHHHLPPDNFQEDPEPVVAHRTSPTNLGLYLLSVVAARDFGWLGTHDAVDRLDATLAAMTRLERYRGHFYNWYDTLTLGPLEPKYISSVDSGNLAGHLITLGQACRQMIASPGVAAHRLDGIDDGLALARESLQRLADNRRTHTVARKQVVDALEAVAGAMSARVGQTVSDLHELVRRADTVVDIARTLHAERNDELSAELQACVEALRATIASHQRDLDLLVSGASPLQDRLQTLLERTQDMFTAMDFGLLFDTDRHLLSIGYRVVAGTLDPSCYDLLASEARLASFVAIAKGDLPTRHWFHLGRTLTPVDGSAALLSWSGSMFEYLMPTLVMRAPPGSLLDETNRVVVRRQIEYGAERERPWGISESAYNARNLELTYQYSSFGVPGLGLKRGLAEEAVVAPYATALATPFAPRAAVLNFERLAGAGGQGRYGWYEALDYTPARVPEGDTVAVVRTYMAHHQGMTILALANALHRGLMSARFHAEPIIQATELLLQERAARDVDAAHDRREWVHAVAYARELVPPTPRRFLSPHQPIPHTQLLSNGRYAVMMTAAGSGYSRWGDIAVTRWREDATCDDWGSYVFLRDVDSGAVWSAGYQPTGIEPDHYEATFFEDRVEIVRRDGAITTTLEVAVSPEDDAEVRRVTIANGGSRTREIELTSYAEVVLAPDAADAAHPAFSKLFVHTDTGRQPREHARAGGRPPRQSARTFIDDSGAILATRRRRSSDEPDLWAAHLAVVEGDLAGTAEFETDRSRFLGRGRGIRNPMSVIDGQPLSNTAGAVLDPIFSLRRRIRLAPGTTAHVTFWTLIAASRSEVLDLADKHHDAAAFDRAVTLAWTQAQVELFHLGIDADEASLFQRLATHLLYANAALRPSSDALARTVGGPSDLWALGISGDLPIVVCRIDDLHDLQIVRQLLRAHDYWRMKQLSVDLVIINEHPPSYAQDLEAALEAAKRASQSRLPSSKGTERGGVFILKGEQVPAATRSVLQSVARAVLFSRRGNLFEQVKRLEEFQPSNSRRPGRASKSMDSSPVVSRRELEFFNGLGGFANGAREYVTTLGEGQWTPAPWINVIANPSFGFQTSVEGGGYAWAVNSQQNQLTPWSNDQVSDRPGDVIYIRDEDDGALWTPTALPIREETAPYSGTHGQGYSRFEHASHGLSIELVQYVPALDPIKISRLTIKNQSGRLRHLSVTAYVEWVLGASRAACAPSVVTEIDPGTRAMLARNHWRTGFDGRVAFADLAGRQTSWTADRKEFLGRNGTLEHPAALDTSAPLTNRVGGGLDPCGALQTKIDLAPHGDAEIVFFLGEAATREDAISLVTRYRTADLDATLRDVTRGWDEVLNTVQVKTPDRAMDVLLNRWLLYQTLASRVWARAGFYQASGAYGFRDQLQDVMALCVSAPQVTRAHLLRAAARQFVEGDVQHWWLPPAGQGVRTRISDDRIWLPYATAHYVEVTGDVSILDEPVPFLEGPVLQADQQESYFEPSISIEQGTLFEHCARALDTSLRLGSHGLPLIGTGDWNDGFNRVGVGGKGESIWLGWFLHAALSAFAPLADSRGEQARGGCWRRHAAALSQSLERDGWDGAWYKRAYFDDGTAIGSQTSAECQIDSIAQSWGVISGAADRERAVTAMAAVDERLVRRADKLVLLFTPPFDRTARDPGYVKGYPPGIRENGGQYTHGAVWAMMAFAMLGDGDKAGDLFSLLNPIGHGATRADIYRYKVEPYVVAGDVYSEPPHAGRGGWTWYTGSAGWMYRTGLEWILGFRLRGTALVIDPCVPKSWRGFTIAFRYRSAQYDIAVENPNGVSRGVARIVLDGVPLQAPDAPIALSDDGTTHHVQVILGT
ncbi:MAG: glucoamylase family protein [Vicinamibacterales bacterium]